MTQPVEYTNLYRFGNPNVRWIGETQLSEFRDGEKPGYRDELLRELGDVLWYIAVLGHVSGFTLEEIMETNINKLRKRATEGSLSGSGDYR